MGERLRHFKRGEPARISPAGMSMKKLILQVAVLLNTTIQVMCDESLTGR